MIELEKLLIEVVERKASDLHITVGERPKLRVDGRLVNSSCEQILSTRDTQQLAYSFLNDKQKKQFEIDGELDLSFSIQNLSRFRVNLFRQRGSVAIAFRQIPFNIMHLSDLGLPGEAIKMAEKPSGLILITGPTGTGKSTTLAAFIDKINSEREGHIITIEDPIEYVHKHKKSLVNQREVGTDTKSFKDALKYALRQDPDVILIGEMRDLETIQTALTIAETGHLAFATLHTSNCAQTINRIIDVFPPYQQVQVRTQLSFVLQGIISQVLVPKISGTGRVLACEFMIATPAIRALIRDDKVHQIYSLIQAGQKFGMQTMNQCLYGLYFNREVALDDILRVSNDPEELLRMIGDAGDGTRRESQPAPDLGDNIFKTF
ncbi:MAG: type IV pilus twitching motility protein PilT [Candidatus Glassbacteria bacterium]